MCTILQVERDYKPVRKEMKDVWKSVVCLDTDRKAVNFSK